MNLVIKSPIKGKKKYLENVNDEAFSGKLLGDGIAVVPEENAIYAPADGTISMVFPTKHAFGIETKNGVSLLIHIGIDTVELSGEGFMGDISVGEKIVQGQKLLEVDFDLVQQSGFETDVIIVITNSNEFAVITLTSKDQVLPSDALIEIG